MRFVVAARSVQRTPSHEAGKHSRLRVGTGGMQQFIRRQFKNPSKITLFVMQPDLGVKDHSIGRPTSQRIVDQPTGIIPAQGMIEVTVSLNSQAEALPAGRYQDQIEFINTVTGEGSTAARNRMASSSRRWNSRRYCCLISGCSCSR